VLLEVDILASIEPAMPQLFEQLQV